MRDPIISTIATGYTGRRAAHAAGESWSKWDGVRIKEHVCRRPSSLGLFLFGTVAATVGAAIALVWR